MGPRTARAVLAVTVLTAAPAAAAEMSQWVDGREMYYTEDPQAVVRFKE